MQAIDSASMRRRSSHDEGARIAAKAWDLIEEQTAQARTPDAGRSRQSPLQARMKDSDMNRPASKAAGYRSNGKIEVGNDLHYHHLNARISCSAQTLLHAAKRRL